MPSPAGLWVGGSGECPRAAGLDAPVRVVLLEFASPALPQKSVSSIGNSVSETNLRGTCILNRGGRGADRNGNLGIAALETGEGNMIRSLSEQVPSRRLARRVLMIALLLPLLLAGVPASGSDSAEDEYDPTETGHPLRIIAYVLHPVGVVLDTLIFRPAHWLGSKEPIKTLVGNTD